MNFINMRIAGGNVGPTSDFETKLTRRERGGRRGVANESRVHRQNMVFGRQIHNQSVKRESIYTASARTFKGGGDTAAIAGGKGDRIGVKLHRKAIVQRVSTKDVER